MISADEIRRWLEPFDPGDSVRTQRSRDTVLALLAGTAEPGSRTQFTPGHVTASGLVLADDGRAVLLVLHARLQRWLQPGGHLESGDASLADAARREVAEETGILVPRSAPRLVGVDVHEIPAARGEPAHRHHDLMFRFVSARREPVAGPGVDRAAWCPVDRLDRFGVDTPLREAVARALKIEG